MIDKLLNCKNKPHALLVIESHLSDFNDFLKNYVKKIVCDRDGCNQCIWCQKINDNKYFDLYIFDAHVNIIKKEEILMLMNKLSFNGIEACNKKFYVIKNIEFASKQVLNSLLKFLEEPPENTYAIFTTKKLNTVLPTIRSRCSNLILPQNDRRINEYLGTTQLTNIQKKIIKRSYSSLENMKNNFDDYLSLFKFCHELQDKNYIVSLKEQLIFFKSLDYNQISIILNILKELFIKNAFYFVDLQDKLYLNPNKTLLFNKILNGVK